MNEPSQTPDRTAVVYTLAAVGFVALVGAGIWLAVYSTRYVPDVVNRLGSAAAYVGSLFSFGSTASLSVVPTPFATTTITTNKTSSLVTEVSENLADLQTKGATAGEKTTTAEPISGATATVFSGLPDLIVTIRAVGYLATSSADSFIASASSTVPAGRRPAVSFSIKNIGTNVSGSWRFSATVPTASVFLYQSQPQQSLNPGDSIDYTLGFDQAIPGVDKLISITANFDRAITESNISNNSASTKVTVLGS